VRARRDHPRFGSRAQVPCYIDRVVYRGRFAPSPTGDIHLGTARSALLAWLRARSERGTFVMRVEDLDGPRSKSEHARSILSDLRWLGIDWDEGPDVGGAFGPYTQSERLDLYLDAVRALERTGHTYPCTCSRKEIAEISSAPHGDDGPIYPGTCRDGPAHPDREPAIRFRMPDPPPRFVDRFAGPSSPELGRGDFVILRKDGAFAYQLACAIDDARMEITEVVRGDDLLSSTPKQIAIYRALDLREPAFVHLPLVLGRDGARLAKRHGAISIAELRARGASAEELVGRIAHAAGLIEDDRPVRASELVADFDLARIGRHPVVHDG
jgi:glutamyl-tRNA synthetase